jgi:outer membrane protein TolC
MAWVLVAAAGLFLSQAGCAGLNLPPPPPAPARAPETPAAGEPVVGAAATEEAQPPEEPGAAREPEPLTLSAALQLALAASPDLRSAAERVEVADAVLARARAEFYPLLRVSEDYGLSNNPQTAFAFTLSQARFSFNQDLNHPGNLDDFHTQLRAQQTLWAGGRRLAQARAAEAREEASAAALGVVQNELVFRVAEAYYRLFQARQLAEVRREAVEQVQRELAVVRARLRVGTAVRLDELTVQVRLSEVEEALITANNRQELAWAVLENVMGARAAHVLPPEPPAAPWSGRVEALEALVEEAGHQRPELAEVAGRRRAAEQDVRAIQAARYASVDFEADYDVHTPDFSGGNSSYFVGLGARLLLFDGHRTASEVRQARARLAELAAHHTRQALDVELEVRRAYLQLADARERFRVAEQAVAYAEAGLSEAEARYRARSATLTQMLDAQLSLSNTRVRFANVAVDVEIARASLERAVGRFTRFAAAKTAGSPRELPPGAPTDPYVRD